MMHLKLGHYFLSGHFSFRVVHTAGMNTSSRASLTAVFFQTVPCTDYQISWKAMLAGPRLKRACLEAEPLFELACSMRAIIRGGSITQKLTKRALKSPDRRFTQLVFLPLNDIIWELHLVAKNLIKLGRPSIQLGVCN